jgi:hypothetical protein
LAEQRRIHLPTVRPELRAALQANRARRDRR